MRCTLCGGKEANRPLTVKSVKSEPSLSITPVASGDKMRCTLCGEEARKGQTFTMTAKAKRLYEDTFNMTADDDLFMCLDCLNHPNKALDRIFQELFAGLPLPRELKQFLIAVGKTKFNSFYRR